MTPATAEQDQQTPAALAVDPQRYDTGSRIERIDVVPVTVPRKGTFDLQRGASATASDCAVVRLQTRDGVVGWGECTTRVRSMHHILRDHLAEVVVGRSVFDVVGAHRAMDVAELLATERPSHWNPIRSAIDMAMYDAQGHTTGVPLHSLLGGKQRDEVETVKNVGVASPEVSAERARQLVDAGYRIVKLRVGSDADLDEARVAAVRAAVGDGIRIRVDANQAWDPTSAIGAIRRMHAYRLHAVEQPCPFWDIAGNAEVVANVEPPVISDEGIWTVPETQNLLRARGADVLHPYLGKCGGIHPTMQIIAVAQAFNAKVSPGERVPLGIGEAAHVHVAAVLRDLEHPCALSYDLNEHDLLTESLPRTGGRIRVPDGPGLGITVDEDRLAHYNREDGPLPWA
jgi:L-alanine-DL-glutamate epimerase-like enolase superfamily enzyme